MEIDVNGKKYLKCDPEQTILEFLEANNIPSKSGCRDGYCGDCRCKLIEGEVVIDKKAIGYTGEGEILACSTKPKPETKKLKIKI